MHDAVAKNRPMTVLEWSMLVVLSSLWGGSFFFNAIAVKELPTFTVVCWRFGLATICGALWRRIAQNITEALVVFSCHGIAQ